MRAFVTGATGLLGSNLVRLLERDGHQVTALVRSRAKGARQLGAGVNLVEGDMANVAAFAPALATHDILFHVAAFFREYYQPGDHWEPLQRINIDGTMALLRAAEAQGVRKVVYASSAGILGKGPAGAPADETTPPDALVHSNLYFRSKLLAEQAIAAFLPASRLDVRLILPGWMFGPGDWAPTSSGAIVRDFLSRKLPVGIDGTGAPVDARDVAEAMLAAVERGRNGERYIVGGDTPVSFRTILELLEELSGVPGPRIYPPYPVALAYGFASELYGRITGRPVLATAEGVRTLREARPTSSAKAISELGATFRPLRDTLRDEIAWFREQQPELFAGVGRTGTELPRR
jgi:dihydroflavonol-4-reductase